MNQAVIEAFLSLKAKESKLINVWKKLGKQFPQYSLAELKAICTKAR